MNASLQRRLVRLERRFALETSSAETQQLIAEQWLLLFQEWEATGDYAAEPDFPLALSCYRQALEQAVHEDPPFYPPEDFRPDLPIVQRILEWRRPRRYPRVQTARNWLSEFIHRVHNGIRPLTEAEFKELASWFHDNEPRLRQRFQSSGLLPLGDGRSESFANIIFWLRQGPREPGAGEAAEVVRKLKTLYGDGIKVSSGDA
jgi:hypothetical protein